MAAANLDALVEEVAHSSPAAARAFSGQLGNTINGLNEYGCWCYFYDDHGRGKGTPVDGIDEMCKTLSTVMNAPCEMPKMKVPLVSLGKLLTFPLSAVPVYPSPKNALKSTPATTAPLEPVPLKVPSLLTFWMSFSVVDPSITITDTLTDSMLPPLVLLKRTVVDLLTKLVVVTT